MNRRELAERWSMSPRTLENWAVLGRGPAPRRFGKRVLYRLADVEAFEQAVFEGVA
ncbi:DNA-binding protein [Mycobacteroides abscessus]|nr:MULTISPECIES: helix-turn-helix domain-containing protein [Mycobacteroides]MDM2407475.1 DNA-binding protein [Mycobacteroides abscessus]MDM2414940.1 DNA-binding protein [Mycobacteroides abscessus]MDO3012247.1 DNA-binding protein [Mycobacteroides abscessus subsp. abscessus]MDO3047302.1 DNA-binding protein [Mycobacteroides abscessus subsp. abscessus]MDO3140251.1 DNA-binding protein [Mycobacteroides abscessus subsp. abscessus]